MFTSLYAGILALIFVVLSLLAVRARWRTRTPLGIGKDEATVRTIRVHGNFAEYVPFGIVMLWLYEAQAGSLYVIHALGITLVLGRLLHILGLRGAVMWARMGGTVLTLGFFAVLGVLLLLKGIRMVQIVSG